MFTNDQGATFSSLHCPSHPCSILSMGSLLFVDEVDVLASSKGLSLIKDLFLLPGAAKRCILIGKCTAALLCSAHHPSEMQP